MEDHEGQLTALITAWATAHTGLVKLFDQLPLRVTLPVVGRNTREAIAATIKAADIAGDQPISQETHRLLLQAVAHWAASYDLIAAYHQEPELWRERAILLNLQQAAVLALMATEELEM